MRVSGHCLGCGRLVARGRPERRRGGIARLPGVREDERAEEEYTADCVWARAAMCRYTREDAGAVGRRDPSSALGALPSSPRRRRWTAAEPSRPLGPRRDATGAPPGASAPLVLRARAERRRARPRARHCTAIAPPTMRARAASPSSRRRAPHAPRRNRAHAVAHALARRARSASRLSILRTQGGQLDSYHATHIHRRSAALDQAAGLSPRPTARPAAPARLAVVAPPWMVSTGTMARSGVHSDMRGVMWPCISDDLLGHVGFEPAAAAWIDRGGPLARPRGGRGIPQPLSATPRRRPFGARQPRHWSCAAPPNFDAHPQSGTSSASAGSRQKKTLRAEEPPSLARPGGAVVERTHNT